MKTMCIIISVLVAAIALLVYIYFKLSKWTITFDSCIKSEDAHRTPEAPEITETRKSLPARDAKGRFTKTA